jgi:ketosteroid isomerase-like protein
MSQENVERLRLHLQPWGEPGGLQATGWGEGDWSLIDPEATYEDDSLPDHAGEVYRGHEGLARATRQMIEPFEDTTIPLERIVGSGDCLVSIHRIRAKARHTGIAFDIPYAYIWDFRDGKIIRGRGFASTKKALKAAGLAD